MKYLLSVNDCEALAILKREGDEKLKVLQDRAAFLDKQRKALKQEADEFRKTQWKAVEKILRERNLIPQNDEDPDLEMNEDGQIFYNGPHKPCDCLACQIKAQL